jgi:hypothetical protein
MVDPQDEVIFLSFPEYRFRLMVERGGCQKVSDLWRHLPESQGDNQLYPHCVDFHYKIPSMTTS